MEIVKRKALSRPELPIWLVGKSVSDANKRMPPMTFDIIYDNIQGLKENFNVTPRLICFDYLQIIPIAGKRTRQEEVSEAITLTKQLAIDVGCPILIGVQAKEAVDSSKSKIPGLADAYYSSVVSHVVDKNFGLLKPVRIAEKGKLVDFGGRYHTIDNNLFVVRMSKQRMDDGSRTWAFNFDMAQMKVWDFWLR
jgi:hypothetical protein